MAPFDEVYDVFLSKECQLETTREEFDKIKDKQPKYRYIAKCGHKHEVFYNVFKSRNTGVLCPNCIMSRNAGLSKDRMKEDKISGLRLEKQCIDYVISKASNTFQIVKAFDGCKADMIFKPITMKEDFWTGIQVKSAAAEKNGYSFHLQNHYKDCIILCMCWEDKRIWMFPSEDVNHLTKISIGLNKSKKYSKYEVTDIVEKLSEYQAKTKQFAFEILDTPIGVNQQREQLYKKHREDKVKCLHFEENGMEGLVYDFKVDGQKVQEKVGTTTCDKIVFYLHKNNGKLGKKRQFQSYRKGDNDFYWLNFPDKKRFYVFPEDILIEHGCIHVDKQKPTLCASLIRKDWKFKYLFNYDDIDEGRLLKLFNK